MKLKSIVMAFLIALCLVGFAGVQKKTKTPPAEQLAFDEPYNLTEVLLKIR